jgi:hypothetical protein
MVPSKMLSPIWGITMSTAMGVLLRNLLYDFVKALRHCSCQYPGKPRNS